MGAALDSCEGCVAVHGACSVHAAAFADRTSSDVPVCPCSMCVYLFHELPAEVRKQAAAEMARVLKPGGIVILTDSMQLGDREVYEHTMG